MWHEARRQEKNIRTIMVDYQRRAERRRDFYQRIRQDPIKFLRIYGHRCKIHVDPEVAAAGENPKNMMPWINDPLVLIDRFDARAHLDFLPETKTHVTPEISKEEKLETRVCDYERYRCLVQNEYANVSEEQCLRQIDIEEKYGSEEEKRKKEEADAMKKKLQESRVAIGFTYSATEEAEDDATVSAAIAVSSKASQGKSSSRKSEAASAAADEDSDGESLADSDMDIDVEIDAYHLNTEQRRQVSRISQQYGMRTSDFLTLLKHDKELEDEVRSIKAIEEAKLRISGKKARKERRIFKEQRLKERNRRMPPTYTGSKFGSAEINPMELLCSSPSSSGSCEEDNGTGQVEYVSFGEECRRVAKSQESSTAAYLASIPLLPPTKPRREETSHEKSKNGTPKTTIGPALPPGMEKRTRSSSSRRSSRRSRSRSRSNRRVSPRRSGRSSSSSSRRSREDSYRGGKARRRSSRSPLTPRRRRQLTSDRSSSSSASGRGGVRPARYRTRSSSSSSDNRSASKTTKSKVEEMANHGIVDDAPVVKKRYYRPELEKEENDLSDVELDGVKSNNQPQFSSRQSLPSSSTSGSSKLRLSGSNQYKSAGAQQLDKGSSATQQPKLTPAEILKLKMQLTLTRAYTEDKKAEQEKQQKIEEERMKREEYLRRMALEMRRRDRERRRAQEKQEESSSSEGEGRRKRRRRRRTSSDTSPSTSSSSSSSSPGSKIKKCRRRRESSSPDYPRGGRHRATAGPRKRSPSSPVSRGRRRRSSSRSNSARSGGARYRRKSHSPTDGPGNRRSWR